MRHFKIAFVFALLFSSASTWASRCATGKTYVTAQDYLGRKALFCPESGDACETLPNGTSVVLLAVLRNPAGITGARVLVTQPSAQALRDSGGTIVSCQLVQSATNGTISYDGQTGAADTLPLNCDNP